MTHDYTNDINNEIETRKAQKLIDERFFERDPSERMDDLTEGEEA